MLECLESVQQDGDEEKEQATGKTHDQSFFQPVSRTRDQGPGHDPEGTHQPDTDE